MKKSIYISLFIASISLFSCKNNSNNTGQASNDSSISVESEILEPVRNFSFDDIPEIDTISYDNYIESVRYIALDSTKAAFVNSFPDIVYVRKIKGKYVVSSLETNKPSAKLFDADGAYISEMFIMGRGPEELLSPFGYVANDSTGVVSYVDFSRLILCYDVNTQTKKRYNFPRTKEPDEMLMQWASFNDGSFAAIKSYPKDERYDDNYLPYLYFIENNVKAGKQLYYPEKRQISQTVIPEVTDFPYESWLLAQTCKGVEFLDMYNDTVYRLSPDMEKTPLYVIERDEKTRPAYSDNKRQRQKKQRYYFETMIDSKNFFVLNYYYNDERRVSVWNNKTGKRIMDVVRGPENHFRPCSLPFSFDGFKGWLPVEYVTEDNKMYVIGNPMFFSKAPSHGKRDANAVVIEIQLKNNI